MKKTSSVVSPPNNNNNGNGQQQNVSSTQNMNVGGSQDGLAMILTAGGRDGGQQQNSFEINFLK